jgi:hypothetical protein
MNKALSSQNLKDMFDGKINIYTYDELSKYHTIDELLAPYGRCIILYFWQTEPSTYGHWTACFKLSNGDIEFYDPFSSIPDENLKEIPKSFRQKNGQDYPYLTKLLYECPYKIHYNDFTTQNEKSSVCGRYCALRVANADLDIDTFNKLWTKNTNNNDKLVLRLTSN